MGVEQVGGAGKGMQRPGSSYRPRHPAHAWALAQAWAHPPADGRDWLLAEDERLRASAASRGADPRRHAHALSRQVCSRTRCPCPRAGWARGAPLLSCGAAIAVRCSPRQSVTPRPPFAHLDAQGHYYARPAIGDAYVAAHYAATQAVACPSRG